jgi:hypothetical protein
MNMYYKVGDHVEILEDDTPFIEGYITEIYIGLEGNKPCPGVVVDDSSGFLIDSFRNIKLKEKL